MNEEFKKFGRRSGIMLCYPFEEKRLLKWGPTWIVQPKLDGVRCRAYVGPDGVRLVSSEGNEFTSVPHINESLKNIAVVREVEFDGELYAHGWPLEDIMSIVSRRENLHPGHQAISYNIFDIINDRLQEDRTLQLQHLKEHIMSEGEDFNLEVVPSTWVSSFDHLMEVYDQILEDGYEGFIVRNPKAFYERKRSTSIMKLKPRKEDVYEIIDTQQEETIHGEGKESLGAFICRGDDGTPFAVGTGPALTREARQSLWKDKENLKGQYLRVKYQNLTSGRGVPRFSVAIQVLDLEERRQP